MTPKEHVAYEKLLNLIIKQEATGKELMDELMLVSRMKAAYEMMKEGR